MPYIKKEDREKINNLVNILSNSIENDGELNYTISLLCHKQLEKRNLKYQNLNNIIGALECVKQELYRIVAGPYEDIKRKENGNISKFDSIN